MTSDEEIVHRCGENMNEDIDIRYERINVEQSSWVINYTWRANNGDVVDGFAEKAGDIIMVDTLLISFCPFCGCKLIEHPKNTW